MDQQLINIGRAANDGTGDTTRDSFRKINVNFGALFPAVAAVQDDARAVAGRVADAAQTAVAGRITGAAPAILAMLGAADDASARAALGVAPTALGRLALRANLLESTADAQEVGFDVLSGALHLNLARADIAKQRTVLPRFRTLDGAVRYVGTSGGPDAIRNASGDWICIDLSDGIVDPIWFGASTSAADNTDAIQAAFTAAPEGASILWGSRIFRVATAPSTSGKSIILIGSGSLRSGLIVTGGGDGPNFVLTGGLQSVVIRGWSSMTTAVDAGWGLRVNYTPGGFADRDDRRLLLDDVKIKGVNQQTQGWYGLYDLININGGCFPKNWMIGRIGPAGTAGGGEADYTNTKVGIRWTGTNYPTDHILDELHAYGIDTVLQIRGAVEGVISKAHVIVACGRFVDWTPDLNFGGRPQLELISGHANVYKGVVKLSAVQQLRVIGGAYYHNPASSSDANMFDLNSVVDGVIETSIFKYSDASRGCAGVVVSGDATSNLILDKIIFGGSYTTLSKGIYVAPGTPGVVIGPNNRFNCIVGVDDQSGGLVQYGKRRAVFYLTNGQSIPSGPETPIAFDTTEENFLGMTPGQLKIPVGVSRVMVSATGVWETNNTGGRFLRIRKNGTFVPRSYATINPAQGGYAPSNATPSIIIPVKQGDILDVTCGQNSGGNLLLQGGGYTSVTLEVVG